MDRALGMGPPFRIDTPFVTTGALGSPVVEVVFRSGQLGLPELGLAAQAVLTVDVEGAGVVSDGAARRKAARVASGAARRAASAIAAWEARASVERPPRAGDMSRVQFAYDEVADGLVRRVAVLFELPLAEGDSNDAVLGRAAPPAASLLVRMADAVHDAVDDPAWSTMFDEG
jgi:hypothetical protein